MGSCSCLRGLTYEKPTNMNSELVRVIFRTDFGLRMCHMKVRNKCELLMFFFYILMKEKQTFFINDALMFLMFLIPHVFVFFQGRPLGGCPRSG